MVPFVPAMQVFSAGRLQLRVGPEQLELTKQPLLPWLPPHPPRVLPWAEIVAVQPLAWGQGLLFVPRTDHPLVLPLGAATEPALAALQKGLHHDRRIA